MSAISSDIWRAISTARQAPKQPKGLDAIWRMLTGHIDTLQPRRARLLHRASKILMLCESLKQLTDQQLHERAQRLRNIFRRGRDTHRDIDLGFALVCELSSRELGMQPRLVQIACALAVEAGCVAEMATGEGKTLAATLPATLAGWRGRGCHLVTANDYLARRDADWMRPLYKRCGLTVESIQSETSSPDRRIAYAADITYCTSREAAADFLRDRLTLNEFGPAGATFFGGANRQSLTAKLVQRGLCAAIVDEADSVLIDEAVTPLIIAATGANKACAKAHQDANRVASSLLENEHYTLDRRHRDVELTDAGLARIAELTAHLPGLWRGARRREELVVQSLIAQLLHHRGAQYVVRDKRIVIIDEFTGRLTPDRQWRDGFHQAVEAKESLCINTPNETLARISFQRFFRLYDKLAGMTGTASEARSELWRTYLLPVVSIPTNRPLRRERLPDRIHIDEDHKWADVVESIERMHSQGRPVLVGTRSVRESEHLNELLFKRKLKPALLNAVRSEEEAEIIASAGRRAHITVSTNMAGRGTDIVLAPGVDKLGGLHVISTGRHASSRIDRQLQGRSGRHGDPGSSQAFVSLDDELLRRFTPFLTAAAKSLSTVRHGEQARGGPLLGRLVRLAQRRSESLGARQRASVARHDDWLDEALGFAGRSA